MTAFLVLSYLAGIAVLAHAFMQSEARWVAADRERSFWLVSMGVATLFGVGLVAAVFYLLGVVPRYGNEPAGDAFRKS